MRYLFLFCCIVINLGCNRKIINSAFDDIARLDYKADYIRVPKAKIKKHLPLIYGRDTALVRADKMTVAFENVRTNTIYN